MLPSLANTRAFFVVEEGVYFIPAPDADKRTSIRFLEFSSGKIRDVAPIEKAVGWGLSVFPVARGLPRTILYTQVDQDGNDLMSIENLRAVAVKPLLASLMLVLLARNARSQVLYGSVVGAVTDPSGSAIPAVVVTMSRTIERLRTRSSNRRCGTLFDHRSASRRLRSAHVETRVPNLSADRHRDHDEHGNARERQA